MNNITATVFLEDDATNEHCVFCSRQTPDRLHISTDIGNLPPSPCCYHCHQILTSV